MAPSRATVELDLDVSGIDITAGRVIGDRRADEENRGFECSGLDEAATREAVSHDWVLAGPSAHQVTCLQHGCASSRIDVGRDALAALGSALAGKNEPAAKAGKENSDKGLLKSVGWLMERVDKALLAH